MKKVGIALKFIGIALIIILVVQIVYMINKQIDTPEVYMSWTEQRCVKVKEHRAKDHGEHFTCEKLPPRYRIVWTK